MSLVALSAMAGVLVVAVAYSAGRLGHASSGWAVSGYWLGQALILVPLAARMLSRRSLTAGATVALVMTLTIAEYLVKVCYSPAAFSYADELAHWRSTLDMVATGRPFTVNELLPISPHYPGLEEATSAFASVTGLPVFPSGLIVAGLAHLTFVCVLYVLFCRISGSHRIAGAAVLLYASNSHFQSFDSMFAYQTLAMLFFGLALLAASRLTRPQPAGCRAGWLTIAVLAILATAMTHHVTSYMLITALAVIALACVLTGDRPAAAWAVTSALLAAVTVAGWLVFAAPQTWDYLQPSIAQAAQGMRALAESGHSSAAHAPAGPPGDQMLGAAALLMTSALLPVGWRQVWRRHRREPWIVAMAIGSAGWYAIVALRLTVANGSELAGRALSFVDVPAGFTVAVALSRLSHAALRWQAPAVAAAVLAAVLTLMFDGLANGWPPYWERLPGAYQAAGFERSVGPEEIASARWALAALGPGNRFATDFGSYCVLGSYGDQNPVLDDGYLYTSATLTHSQVLRAQAQSVRFLLADRRLSLSLPASGQYFPLDSHAGSYTRPLRAAGLTKFNRVPGIARIYDSGNIVIYDLGRLTYAP